MIVDMMGREEAEMAKLTTEQAAARVMGRRYEGHGFPGSAFTVIAVEGRWAKLAGRAGHAAVTLTADVVDLATNSPYWHDLGVADTTARAA